MWIPDVTDQRRKMRLARYGTTRQRLMLRAINEVSHDCAAASHKERRQLAEKLIRMAGDRMSFEEPVSFMFGPILHDDTRRVLDRLIQRGYIRTVGYDTHGVMDSSLVYPATTLFSNAVVMDSDTELDEVVDLMEIAKVASDHEAKEAGQ